MSFLGLLRRALKIGPKHRGYLVFTTPDGKQTFYSPYHQLEHLSDDGKVRAQIVVTAGPERVPPNHQHKGPFAADLKSAFADGIVEQVFEVYFVNTSGEPVSVRVRHVGLCDIGLDVDTPLELAPRGTAITPGLITLTSNFGTKTRVKLAYEYAGKRYEIDGAARRLTMDEVKNARFG